MNSLRHYLHFHGACAVAVMFAALSGGCMSSRYQPAKKLTAAEPLHLNSAPAAVTASVNGVITRQGPGSWKRNAYWDEYLVTITNHSDAPVTLRTASLVGLAGEPSNAGADPWQIEQESQTQAERNFGLAKNTVVHIGGGVTTVVAGAGFGAAVAGGGGAFVPAAAYGAALGGLVAIPVFAGTSIYRNVHGRHEIQREFERRRIAFPARIAPGETRQGSLFFVITPGPKTLTVTFDTPAASNDTTTVDLAGISRLHLATTP